MNKYRFQYTFTRIPDFMRFSKLFYVVFLLTCMQCRSPYNIDIGDQNVLYQVSAYVVPSKPILFYVSKVGQPVGEADYQLKDTAKIYFTNGSNEYLIEPKYFLNQLSNDFSRLLKLHHSYSQDCQIHQATEFRN